MTEEQLSKINKFKQLLDGGKRIGSSQTRELTSLYNEVLGKRVSNTSCSSCIRRRISELYNYVKNQENGTDNK